MKLEESFFDREPFQVAKDLLGHYFVRKTEQGEVRGVITETEAYGDQNDLASHISRGITNRNKIMLEKPGTLYVYHIYGISYLTNIICCEKGKAGAVLIRSAEIIEGQELAKENIYKSKFVKLNDQLATGPGKFSLAFGITKNENGLDISNSDNFYISKDKKDFKDIVSAKRIGVDYAKECKDLPWRFYIKNNNFVSKKIGQKASQ